MVFGEASQLPGEIYRSARTAKDRELAQVAVLMQLGWNIQRVWAMDWWDNSAKSCAETANSHAYG